MSVMGDIGCRIVIPTEILGAEAGRGPRLPSDGPNWAGVEHSLGSGDSILHWTHASLEGGRDIN